MDDILKVTLNLADTAAYDGVNEAYEEVLDSPYPARLTVGVCKLLGDATVTLDAVIALE